jgi:hypothetical protein
MLKVHETFISSPGLARVTVDGKYVSQKEEPVPTAPLKSPGAGTVNVLLEELNHAESIPLPSGPVLVRLPSAHVSFTIIVSVA